MLAMSNRSGSRSKNNLQDLKVNTGIQRKPLKMLIFENGDMGLVRHSANPTDSCVYVMLCNVMLCYVILCYVMSCHVMLCYVMLYG